MSTLIGLATLLLHAGLMAVAAPALAGLAGCLRARLAGRAGPPLVQPFRDLWRLARKQPAMPEEAWVLQAGPLAALAALAAAALLVPSFALGMTTAPIADLIVVTGLLTAAQVTMASAGLDSGTAIGGISASRAMSLAVLTEPALLLAVFAVATMAGSTNLDSVAAAVREGGAGLRVSWALALAAGAIVVITKAAQFQGGEVLGGDVLGLGQDTSRLALSGWLLAAAEYAAGLRLLVWLSLLVVMFVPAGIAPAASGPGPLAVGVLAWAAKLTVACAGLALFEAARPALRWSGAPELLGMALLLGLLAAVFLFVGQGLA